MVQSNAERFLDAYARIERKLSELVHDTHYVAFNQMLFRVAKSNRIISNNLQSLKEYNELRNAIVHQRGPNLEIVAQPTDEVTKDIEHIASLLDAPMKISHYASKPVYVVHPDDPIEKAFEVMQKLETSKVPVYQKQNYMGLVTMEEIAKWAMEKSEKKYIEELLDINHDKVIFLKKDDDIQSAIYAFENALTSGKNLRAIIITEHGNNKEKPHGIITVADLPKIIKSLV